MCMNIIPYAGIWGSNKGQILIESNKFHVELQPYMLVGKPGITIRAPLGSYSESTASVGQLSTDFLTDPIISEASCPICLDALCNHSPLRPCNLLPYEYNIDHESMIHKPILSQ